MTLPTLRTAWHATVLCGAQMRMWPTQGLVKNGITTTSQAYLAGVCDTACGGNWCFPSLTFSSAHICALPSVRSHGLRISISIANTTARVLWVGRQSFSYPPPSYQGIMGRF
eukprot:1157718-Pelagomonas_calceolata.AAC.5